MIVLNDAMNDDMPTHLRLNAFANNIVAKGITRALKIGERSLPEFLRANKFVVSSEMKALTFSSHQSHFHQHTHFLCT